MSVVLPVYNAGPYLDLAVQSILAQTFRDFELIAVDDGSTDDSPRKLGRFAAADPRVRVVSRANTGIVGALNDGLATARGGIIARMDADDWSAPGRFAAQVAYLDAHPECVCVGSSVIFMDAGSDPVKLCRRLTSHRKLEQGLLDADGGALIHPSVMFRAEAVRKAGGYRREYQYVEDCDLFLRLATIGELANLDEPLLFYRVHATSINFVRNEGRYRLLQNLLAEAHTRRGLTYVPPNSPDPVAAWSDIAALHREWSATALHFGSRRVAVRQGLQACRLDPWNVKSWRALRYALGGPLETPPDSAIFPKRRP